MPKKKKVLLEEMSKYVNGIYHRVNDGEIIPSYITDNLKHELRDYQIYALRNLMIMLKAKNNLKSETHEVFKEFLNVNQFLYRMATGSGKTNVLASSILALYKEKNIQRFIFTTNLKSILRKTEDNLINEASEKYLFNQKINIDGKTIRISRVLENEDFPNSNPDTIYIKIVSIQSLSSQLNESSAKEGQSSLTNIIEEDIALLVDEAHHFNANATVQKIKSTENTATYEKTMDIIRNSVESNNKFVIQLEFTATLPFGSKGKEKKVRDKYLDKLLFNYTLKEFVIKDSSGSGGYGKHLSQIEANETIESKMLTGVLMNQYRKYLAKIHGYINFKPVILFKSNNVEPSFQAQKIFENLLQDLTVEQVDQHISKTLRGTHSQAINWFLEFYSNLHDKNVFILSIKEDFLGHILNANNDKNEERNINNLNTLDDIDNPYRAIFAVEKISEGWDVLNLYDIVRVSERTKKPNTNAEAQLVGRGSRYYPLTHENGEKIYKQKFSFDDERILLETFHYHTIQEQNYLKQLSESYSALGIPIELDKPAKTYSVALKPEFKKDYFYQYGYFMENTATQPEKSDFYNLKSYGFSNGFIFHVSSGIREKVVFKEEEKERIQEIPKRIESKYILEAMSRIPFYRFNTMKKYMPLLHSKKDFIEEEEWLGSWNHIINFILPEEKSLETEDILRGTVEFLINLSTLIQKNFMKSKGTKNFVKVPAKNRLIDFYKRSYKEEADSLSEVDYIKTENKMWSPYTKIIGNKLERNMVKMIEENILPELENKYEKVYLIRNDEVYNKVGIHQFNGTNKFYPDFILYLLEKDTSKVTQIYLEPKGEQLLERDNWKLEILESLGRDIEIVMNETIDNFELLGVKFFTGTPENYNEFEDELRLKANLPSYEINFKSLDNKK